MLPRNLQPDAWRHSWWLGGNPSIGAWRHPDASRRYEFASAGDNDKQMLILRSLIEDFGGEATSASLSSRIAGPLQTRIGHAAQSCTEVRAVLDLLESCGALALENLDGTEVIARITPAGATLCYAQNAAGTDFGPA